MRTEHRIVAFWDADDTKDKYFVSTLTHNFNEAFQEMVADMGPPSRIVFRATGEGWVHAPDHTVLWSSYVERPDTKLDAKP